MDRCGDTEKGCQNLLYSIRLLVIPQFIIAAKWYPNYVKDIYLLEGIQG